MTPLTQMKCIPCEGGVPPLEDDRVAELMPQLEGWSVVNGQRLSKAYSFGDFAQALAFVNRIGVVAEQEGHHPDLFLSWGLVRIELWTHKIGGLSESDFILAAKIDALP